MKIRCTIIIVNWNTKNYLEKCLSSIFSHIPVENILVIVVDNASTDGSAEMVQSQFPSVELIQNSQNVGFAPGCNQGIKRADSEYILLLNSDCEITSPNFFNEVIFVFEHNQKIAIAGPIIIYPNGKLQSAGQRFLTLKRVFLEQVLFTTAPIFAKSLESVEHLKRNAPFEVDWISGSCLFARKSIFEQIGYLQDSLFMYAEDMELCFRVQNAGYSVVIVPTVSIIHYKSKSTNKNLSDVLKYSVRNNCLFIKKRQGKIAALFTLFFYLIGIVFRLVLSFFRQKTNPLEWFRLSLKMPSIASDVLK